MTRNEAEELMTRIGCLDTRNVACLHLAYVHYADRVGRGLCQSLPVAEAYALLVEELKKPPAVKQGALFTDKGADL
jgi:hypothetical protein